MLNKYLILLLGFSFLISFSYAQEKEAKKLNFGAEINSQMSYSGLSSGVQVNLLHKKHSLGIGTKITYQSSYFPYQNAMGLIVDYKYFVMENKNMRAFIAVNYNNTVYKSLRRDADKFNIIHEYTISNGLLVKAYKNLWIGNSIGIGAYTEQYYDYSETEYGAYLGYNIMFKVMANYEF
jgi:hypothetical protein